MIYSRLLFLYTMLLSAMMAIALTKFFSLRAKFASVLVILVLMAVLGLPVGATWTGPTATRLRTESDVIAKIESLENLTTIVSLQSRSMDAMYGLVSPAPVDVMATENKGPSPDTEKAVPDRVKSDVEPAPAATPAPAAASAFMQGDRPLWPQLFDGVQKTDKRVAVMCLSRRSAFSLRQAIRETWAKEQTNVYFVVGAGCPIPNGHRKKKPFGACQREHPSDDAQQAAWDAEVKNEDEQLDREAASHGDIARMPGIDSYATLPQKIKFMYEWGVAHTEAEWFVKADDDTVVRVDLLISWINQQTTNGELNAAVPTVIGSIASGWGIHRSGKWAEHNYKQKKYPTFPLGSVGHIVSRPVAKYFSENAASLFDYQGEDVSVGIWLDESPLKDSVKFVDGTSVMTNDGNCKNKNNYVIGHDIGELKMRRCFK